MQKVRFHQGSFHAWLNGVLQRLHVNYHRRRQQERKRRDELPEDDTLGVADHDNEGLDEQVTARRGQLRRSLDEILVRYEH